ncbi:hypothetical protein [Orlajensenia leifsoniae]|uniref:SRPBCC family protein n=1 Tax=Orlajensenia leifsoniae TaxID=2561933 RepID=A0A4Y9R7E8_9MICO|nr:hypothetical protein [Leifsonia flava]TFW00178.1 hypothetical protein E4M00_03040 [Leifsonia flava]
MTVIRFQLTSTLSPDAALAVLTDFSSDRPKNWPSIDAEHFTVHELGDTWAEVTEGTAAAWERARYEWDPAKRRVEITTHDSKVFGPGGGWVFQLTPIVGGTQIDVELTRTPTAFSGKLLAALLPIVGPSTLAKSFRQPLKTK